MGGNAFDNSEKLTPEQYKVITQKITEIIQPICEKIQPYIPLPEKELHGDVDFLILLKPGNTLRNVQQLIGISKQHFILNNNQTANSLYCNKQVDFNSAKDEQEFDRCRFYKSYGGIGAFLGIFLPDKTVKLNENGIICCGFHQHLKLQFTACDRIDDILSFFGLDPHRYHAGFKTRKQLFNYLRQTSFLDEKRFLDHTTKHQTKIMVHFQQFVKSQGPRQNKNYKQYKDICRDTLIHFGKEKEFDKAWQEKLENQLKKKYRQNKWNGMHIIQLFGVASKDVNKFKKKFEDSFTSKEEYLAYIDINSFEEISGLFSKVCGLNPVANN